MNLKQHIKEAEGRFDKRHTGLGTDYHVWTKDEIKQFLSQELTRLAEEIKREVVPEERKHRDNCEMEIMEYDAPFCNCGAENLNFNRQEIINRFDKFLK